MIPTKTIVIASLVGAGFVAASLALYFAVIKSRDKDGVGPTARVRSAGSGNLPVCLAVPGARSIDGSNDLQGMPFALTAVRPNQRQTFTLFDRATGQIVGRHDVASLDGLNLWRVTCQLTTHDSLRRDSLPNYGGRYFGPLVTVTATMRGGRGDRTLVRQQPYLPEDRTELTFAPVPLRDIERLTVTLDLTTQATGDVLPADVGYHVRARTFFLALVPVARCRDYARLQVAVDSPAYLPSL
jgi:hypothetical protein